MKKRRVMLFAIGLVLFFAGTSKPAFKFWGKTKQSAAPEAKKKVTGEPLYKKLGISSLLKAPKKPSGAGKKRWTIGSIFKKEKKQLAPDEQKARYMRSIKSDLEKQEKAKAKELKALTDELAKAQKKGDWSKVEEIADVHMKKNASEVEQIRKNLQELEKIKALGASEKSVKEKIMETDGVKKVIEVLTDGEKNLLKSLGGSAWKEVGQKARKSLEEKIGGIKTKLGLGVATSKFQADDEDLTLKKRTPEEKQERIEKYLKKKEQVKELDEMGKDAMSGSTLVKKVSPQELLKSRQQRLKQQTSLKNARKKVLQSMIKKAKKGEWTVETAEVVKKLESALAETQADLTTLKKGQELKVPVVNKAQTTITDFRPKQKMFVEDIDEPKAPKMDRIEKNPQIKKQIIEETKVEQQVTKEPPTPPKKVLSREERLKAGSTGLKKVQTPEVKKPPTPPKKALSREEQLKAGSTGLKNVQTPKVEEPKKVPMMLQEQIRQGTELKKVKSVQKKETSTTSTMSDIAKGITGIRKAVAGDEDDDFGDVSVGDDW